MIRKFLIILTFVGFGTLAFAQEQGALRAGAGLAYGFEVEELGSTWELNTSLPIISPVG